MHESNLKTVKLQHNRLN